MPTTRTFTLNRERTISTVARRVFEIEDGRAGRESLALAEAALLRANPQLNSSSGFVSGARVVVPAHRGLRLRETVVSRDQGVDNVTEETSKRLHLAGAKFNAAFGAAQERREKTLEEISSAGFQREARRSLSESAQLIAKSAERLKEEGERTKRVQERLSSAVSLAEEGLKTLDTLAKRTRR